MSFFRLKGLVSRVSKVGLMLAPLSPFIYANEKIFLTGSFAPVTFHGTSYQSGAGKISYTPNKYFVSSIRYLAEAESPCQKMDCKDYPNNSTTLHGINETSVVVGTIYKNTQGYLSCQAGIGGSFGQNILIDSIGAESRDRFKVISIPIDLEAMAYVGKYFGFGITGYGDINKKGNIFGIMGSIQLRIQ